MTSTGLFVSVPSRSAAVALSAALRRRTELATCNIVEAAHVVVSRGSIERIQSRWSTAEYQSRAYGLFPSELTRLESVVMNAPAPQSLLAMRVIDLCLADAPFIVVSARAADGSPEAGPWIDEVTRPFDRTISSIRLRLVTRSSAGRLARLLERPSPQRLDRGLDRALLAATLGDADVARQGWRTWRATAEFDDSAFALHHVGPMLYENLFRLGIEDDDVMGRLKGVRRRAWYVNQLRLSDAAQSVEVLQRVGIDPVVLGDVALSGAAADESSVRPIRRLELCVEPDEAHRALEALESDAWSPATHEPRGDAMIERRNSVRLHHDSRHVLHLHWRPYPARSTSLLSSADEVDGERIALHTVSARVQNPTRQLMRVWCRSSDAEPGHQLRTICDTAELLDRMSERIDHDQLWDDCTRLGLTEYGRWYMDTLRSIPGR